MSGAFTNIFTLTYGFIEGPAMHWRPQDIGSLIVGSISAVIFIWYELHRRDPLLDLKLFRSRNFTGANVATFAMYGALAGFMFAFAIYLQTRLGYSSLQAGLASLPVTVLLLAFSSRVGSWSMRYGTRIFMTVGPLLVGIGIATLAPLHAGSSYLTAILPGIILFGVGLALTVSPLTSTVMTSVPESQASIASGVDNAVSRVAGLIVIALLGLFGTAHAYQFAAGLCAGLAALAGILSYILISPRITRSKL